VWVAKEVKFHISLIASARNLDSSIANKIGYTLHVFSLRFTTCKSKRKSKNKISEKQPQKKKERLSLCGFRVLLLDFIEVPLVVYTAQALTG